MAVSISGTSGTWTHGSAITVSGSGFGTKSTAAPVVWDNCSGTTVLDLWDGRWPTGTAEDPLGSAAYCPEYRSTQRSIPLPHTRISKYLCGCHYDNAGAQYGYNVMFWKNLTFSSGQYVYFNWKERIDDAWVFGGDDNFKTWDYSEGSQPYELNAAVGANWYIEYNPRPTSTSSECTWHINDDDTDSDPNPYNLEFPTDQNGENWFWEAGVNPMSGVWRSMELEVKLTAHPNDHTGYIKQWENGTLKINYLGHTDGMSGTSRTLAIGGYARNQANTNQWRYFADIYYDTTRARVVLGNASTFTTCTNREMQIPTSWSGTSIGITANLGMFGNNDTAWVYVVDSDGAVNANGFQITLGSGGAAQTRTAPLIL